MALVCIMGCRPCWYPSPFSFAFHISELLHPLFFACHWISFLFLLHDRRICTHSVGLSITNFFRIVSRLGTVSGTRCCGPRGAAGVCMKQKSRFRFLPWLVFEPQTLQSNGRERYCSAPPFNRLLRHAVGYRGAILTPKPV